MRWGGHLLTIGLLTALAHLGGLAWLAAVMIGRRGMTITCICNFEGRIEYFQSKEARGVIEAAPFGA